MLPLPAHFTMFEDKCIWYPDETSNYAFYDECLTKLLLIAALLLIGVMSVSINIHRAARINKRRLNSERKHGGIWKRMRTLFVCIFSPLLASLCQHFLILRAVCYTLRICKLKTSSSSPLRTAERERKKIPATKLPVVTEVAFRAEYLSTAWNKWAGRNAKKWHFDDFSKARWLWDARAFGPHSARKYWDVLRLALTWLWFSCPDTDSDTWTLCWHYLCLFRSAINYREPTKKNWKKK